MRPRFRPLGALAAALSLCACSSLKTSCLQDARVLPKGAIAVSGEYASAFFEDAALLTGGHARDSVLGEAWRADTSARYFIVSAIPLVGASLSVGAGQGWEFGIGADFALFSEDAWTMDTYAKKRVYADGDGGFASLFARGYIGSAVGYLDFYDHANAYRHYRYRSNTAGLELQAMYLGRLARKLGYYLNAGPGIGNLDYGLEGRNGQPDRGGDIPLYGFRLHAGMVFETHRFELAWETGLHVFNYGMTPVLGIRAAFKNDWRR